MTATAPLRVRDIVATPVVVPMARVVRTASGTIAEAPLLLIDLHTDGGVTGRAYLFGYSAFTLKPLADLVTSMADMIRGDALTPRELQRKLRARFMLFGAKHLAGMALAGVDMAAWDALGCAVGAPVVRMLGAEPRALPAYYGYGIGVLPVDEVPDEAAKLAAEGFKGLKIRLGRANFSDDVAAVRAARRALADDVALVADFNQSLTVTEAIRRGRLLDDEGLYWIEEPVRADDFSGCARVADALRTPIQIGENLTGAFEMHEALRQGACDYIMADAQQIGGVTGWMEAAALAHVFGRELSSHLFQETSAHLLAASPTAAWLEYMNVADPILAEPLAAVDGTIAATERPGLGMTWDPEAVRRYTVR